MTHIKTIAATAVIAVVGTVVAFGGLHLGQSPAKAATTHAAKHKTTYVIKLTPKQLAKMLQGQNRTVVKYQGATHTQRRATNHTGTYRDATRSYSRSGSTYSQRSGSYNGYRWQQLRQRLTLGLLGRRLGLRRLRRRLLVRESHAKGRRPQCRHPSRRS